MGWIALRAIAAATCAVSLVVSGPVSAETEPDAEALKSLPFEEAVAQSGESDIDVTIRIMRYFVRLSLAKLFYPVDLRRPSAPLDDDDTVEAVKGFERKIGGVVDGSLSLSELEQLFKLVSLSTLTPLYIGFGKSVQSHEGLNAVYAFGTWSMPDIAYPLNRSSITCLIAEGTCEDKSIIVRGPSISRGTGHDHSYVLAEATDTYKIESWKNGILDALGGTACRRVRLTINTITELVSQTVEDLDPLGCLIPGTEQRLPPIAALRVSTLVSTSDADREFRETIEAVVRSASGPILNTFEAER